ncbi:hypothetical protein DFR67_11657 [Williamsia limnetica]|uniref:Uncharacterized protein n=2 Tax=Williamsia limnetica TaxID=882452 RepID=A0A318RBW7_WILLI|nr:hypothetical protein DFR67_11657 [Williamsia limnetica]
MMTNPARDARLDTEAATYPDGSLKMGWAVAMSMATVQDYADGKSKAEPGETEIDVP